MQFGWARKGMAAVLAAAGPAWVGAADEAAWEAFDKADKELGVLDAELRICTAALDACREGVAARKASELKALREAVEEAEKAATSAHTAAGLDGARDKLQAARAARSGKVEALAAAAPSFRAAKEKYATLNKKIEEMTARIGKLKADEMLELVRLRMEERDLGKHIDGSLRAWWLRGEVAAEYQAADDAYKAYGTASAKAEAVKQANEKVKAARKALDAAVAALPVEGAAAEALQAKRTELEAKIALLRAKRDEMEKTLVAGKTVNVSIKVTDPKTKAEVEKRASLWVPNCESVRGVIVAHPMIGGLASARPIRLAAAREALAAMVYGEIASDPKAAVEHFDALFEKFGAACGHPELKGAPILVGGLSASVLATRNIACIVPERVFGVVHVAGGNMQEMPDGGKGMVQVPFFAHNGEFEWCGPAGGGHASGKFGIRPQYGNQTQWVMIREQMLRLWRGKHEHRMSLVVVPNRDHGAWDAELTGLFVRKAAQYRIPKEKRDGSTPAKCLPLPAEKGWLTDADLDHPTQQPAAYKEYKGDKDNAFWHLDEEMAKAVFEYHKGRFILPDPTKAYPVPSDWPAKDK